MTTLMTVPEAAYVSVYELGCWRWKEMRNHLSKMQGQQAMTRKGRPSVEWIEGSGMFKRTFVVIGRMADIMVIHHLMNFTPPIRKRMENAGIAALLAIAVVGGTSPLWADDTSRSNFADKQARERQERTVARSGNALNDDGSINYQRMGTYLAQTRQNPTIYRNTPTASFWTGYGPYSIFSKEFWTNPRSSVGIGTPYEGGIGRDGVLGGPGIGQWGAGGGTGAGARGY